MPLVSYSCLSSSTWLKTIVLSTAVFSTLIISGCVSKPQVSTPATRYASAPDYYTVRAGDTLSGIAARYGMNYLNIAALNQISPPYIISVGQYLKLKNTTNSRVNTSQIQVLDQQPLSRQNANSSSSTGNSSSVVIVSNPHSTSGTGSVVQPPTTPIPTVVAPPITTTTITPPVIPTVPVPTTPQVVTPPPSLATQQVAGITWVAPYYGQVLAHFNEAKGIKGIQFSGNKGDAVYAAADGQVVYAADGLPEYGKMIIIKHNNNYISTYAHNNTLLVKNADIVKAGQKIAEMGSTGTNRTLLEVQVRLNGKAINPMTVLPIK